ncbi:MAG: twin-arginine translocase TatA/TatE family subunit [Alphaproteobacteria bacterium]|nr:twin-arginine translocase TatA/TatE family subunit [Alphaproteobacteria bacterium]
MGSFSIWHWLIVLAVVLVLFGGGGKISRLMGDFGKGLKNFKKSMKEDEGDSDAKKEIESETIPKAETPGVDEKDKAEKPAAKEKDKAASG